MAMFENLGHFFKRMVKTEQQKELGSKDAAKERLHLVLMQDRANVSADFLELMKQEIIDVIKKYIVVDEESIDVRLTNQANNDGTNGAPSLYANIPIVNIKNDMMAQKVKEFEGVDFNKEMGIPSKTPEEPVKEEEVQTPEVIELPENIEEATLNEENVEEVPQEIQAKEETEEVEPQEMFEEVDEAYEDDDDDVTFDDLLKAAEAAEAQASEAELEIEKEDSETEQEIEKVDSEEEEESIIEIIEENKEDKEENDTTESENTEEVVEVEEVEKIVKKENKKSSSKGKGKSSNSKSKDKRKKKK